MPIADAVDTRNLSGISRIVREGTAVKFCLPAGTYNHQALETESVIIPMRNFHGDQWFTLCVSSQIGCRMGCTFCQTGMMGLLANLSSQQILEQLRTARMLLRADAVESATPSDIRNVVFMGMGEPLDNFDAVMEAIREMSTPGEFNIPLSRITVSTVGKADGIRKLAAMNWPSLRLAVSLTAATDALRSRLMPVNRAVPLEELRRVLLEYPRNGRTRFLIEYVMLKGVNDSLADADALAQWCRPLPVTVNLIPYNPQNPARFESSDSQTIVAFLTHLRALGILAKRRVTLGQPLMAACGQLGNAALRRNAPRPVIGG
jgi:23S rRNA (adenine2503-C2)-methyltransferase